MSESQSASSGPCHHKIIWPGPWPIPNLSNLLCVKCEHTLIWDEPSKANNWKGFISEPDEEEWAMLRQDPDWQAANA